MRSALPTAGRASLVAVGLAAAVLLLFYGTGDASAWSFIPYSATFAVGLLLSVRRPGNALGWVFLATGTLGFLASGCSAFALEALGADPGSDTARLAAWVAALAYTVSWPLSTVLPLLLFPEGLQSPRWRPVLRFVVLIMALIAVWYVLFPTLFLDLDGDSVGAEFDNPVSPLTPENFGQWWIMQPLLTWAAMGCLIIAIFGVARRFRRSRGVERQQMRWFAFAALTYLLCQVLIATLNVLDIAYFGSGVSQALMALGMAFFPVACGIAIMRHGLYEIDRILSRTVSYALVTATVVGVYAVLVTSATRLLSASSTLVIAVATLAAAAIFRPVLGRVQGRVDRRFNRDRYDAERTLEQYVARLRGQVDTDDVVEDLLAVLERTVQPRASGVWLRESS